MVTHLHVPEDPDHKDWNYIRFSKRTCIEWAPQHDSNPEGDIKIFELRFLVCFDSHKFVLDGIINNFEIAMRDTQRFCAKLYN
jgi:hypothetical protein